jgi:hypothetical protein
MNDHAHDSTDADSTPTQAVLYEDLKRIGELEDQKTAIQKEIDERTDRLKNAIPHLDKGSLLQQMLSATLTPKSAPKAAVATKRSTKAAKKKTARKRP